MTELAQTLPTSEAQENEDSSFLARLFKSRRFRIFAALSTVVSLLGVLIFLFRPRLDYDINGVEPIDLDSNDAFATMELLANAKQRPARTIEVLTNGEVFYEAQLQAIRSAQRSINMENYIFHPGNIGERFVAALAERARAGVDVKVVLDAIGSASNSEKFMKPLTEAGGKLAWYHAPHWYTIDRMNNRTHRNILVVDASVGFVGGAGIDDRWLQVTNEKPRWRDTVFRLTGDAVAGLQAVFIENWLETTGELLNPKYYFPETLNDDGQRIALVVRSTPSSGGSTSARMLYQALIVSAKTRLHITNPYFIPDKSLSRALIEAKKNRGIDIKIITPGANSDQAIAQASSRARYGDLLEAGIEIYEYQPTMIHTKSLLVDDAWAVVGTTNIDPRSFGLNDEVNVIARDPAMTAHLERDFQRDLERSKRVTLDQWRNRGLWQRAQEWVSQLMLRQL